MKKQVLYICSVLLGLNMLSCKNFLETTPEGVLSPVNYYENEKQIFTALVGVYNTLSDTRNGNPTYGGAYIYAMGTEGDEGYYRSGPQRNNVGQFIYNAGVPILADFWRMMYRGINHANVLLENLDKADMDDEQRNIVRGETLFLRGYFYFLLVSNFGDVPLVLESTKSPTGNLVARTPSREVYSQIVRDMEEAFGLVMTGTQVGHGGRVNKSTVAGILARVNLYWAGYPAPDESRYAEARKWAAVVMNPDEVGTVHELNPSYAQVFINHAQDLYDIKESIWEVEFYGNRTDRPRQAGTVGNYIGIRNSGDVIGRSNANVRASARLYRLYEPEDARRDWCVAPYEYLPIDSDIKAPYAATNIWSRYAGKYRRENETFMPKAVGYTSINYPLLRYSDVLLMFAEAENHINGPTPAAINAVNLVRGRAGASLLEGPTVPPNKTEFLYLIQDERSRELAFESLRRSDLIRWNIYVDAMKTLAADYEFSAGVPSVSRTVVPHLKNVSQKHMLWPIPTRELMLNRLLTQNPGW